MDSDSDIYSDIESYSDSDSDVDEDEQLQMILDEQERDIDYVKQLKPSQPVINLVQPPPPPPFMRANNLNPMPNARSRSNSKGHHRDSKGGADDDDDDGDEESSRDLGVTQKVRPQRRGSIDEDRGDDGGEPRCWKRVDESEMTFGDEPPRKSTSLTSKNFCSCKKVLTSGPPVRPPAPSEGDYPTYQPAPTQQSSLIHVQPSPPLPALVDPHFHSPDVSASTPFYPYHQFSPQYCVPPSFPFPPYGPPYYPATPPRLSTAGARPSTTTVGPFGFRTGGHTLIEPEGNTFYLPKQPTHKIRDIIKTRFDAMYVFWKKVPKETRDIWFREFEKEFYWQPQHHNRIRKNFEKRGSTRMRDIFTDIRKFGERPLWIGESIWEDLNRAWGTPEYTRRREQNKQNRASDVGGLESSLPTGGSVPHTEHRRCLDEYTRFRESQPVAGEGSSCGSSDPYAEYCIWSQAVGGMQHGRVYGLGSQAQVYERQTSTTPTFRPSPQESYFAGQVAVLHAELEQIRKVQADWQNQMHLQQEQIREQNAQLLEEIRLMREQFSGKQPTIKEEET